MSARLVLLLISSIALRHGSSGQFHAIFTSTPDSALVRMNGKEYGRTPCLVSYRWNQKVEGRIVFDVSAPGFETWRDTLSAKPRRFDQEHRLDLVRDIPELDLDSSVVVVAFDRLLAEFKDGTPIGHHTNKEGRTEVLKWEGTFKIGVQSFEQRFEEILMKAGFRTPVMRSAKLFAGGRDDRPALPRFVVGARIMDYSIEERYSVDKHYDAGPVSGVTRMRIDWQVMDKSTGQVALSVTTDGSARYRRWSNQGVGENLAAFEDALLEFLREGRFTELVKRTKVTGPTSYAPPIDTTMRITLPRVAPPSFKNLSELIQFAERSCVTVLTDGGHGSGAIISAEGLVLSAHHVVNGVNRIEVLFADGLKQEARLVSFDAAHDVALLDIAGSGFKPLPLGTSANLSLGEEVITIGTPAEVVLGQSVARGILSGKRNMEGHVYLQTDMSVSPGNSGGPLIDARGAIIGVVQRKVVGDAVEGIGLAIPIEQAMESLQLRVEGP